MPAEKTRFTTPFTAGSTAAEVVDGIDLTGRRAIVTGASSGIGVETARALAGAGAEVTLAVRDLAAAERVAKDIVATTGNERVRIGRLDLSDQTSVREFTGGWQGPLHILVNNAGVMMTPELRTPEGWELQFATNHLGHFTLTTGLHGALVEAGRARVVSLTSVGHLRGGVDFDDIHFDRRPYDGSIAYGQSKTATSLFAVEAHRRWAAEGITVNAVHPGAILETGLARHLSKEALDHAVQNGGYLFKTPQQGAATSVMAATWQPLEGIGGLYFEDGNEALPHSAEVPAGVAPFAIDPAAASRLWQVTEDMLAARS